MVLKIGTLILFQICSLLLWEESKRVKKKGASGQDIKEQLSILPGAKIRESLMFYHYQYFCGGMTGTRCTHIRDVQQLFK